MNFAVAQTTMTSSLVIETTAVMPSSEKTWIECSFDAAVMDDSSSPSSIESSSSGNKLKYPCMIDSSETMIEGTPMVNFKNDDNKDFEDVDGFAMMHIKIVKFPEGDIQNFTKLISLTITACDLPEISFKNLQFYQELEKLDLSVNKIQVIPPELFQHNPELKEINFGQNLIFHIDPLVFREEQFSKVAFNFKDNNCTIIGGDNSTEVSQNYNLKYFFLFKIIKF